jgi:Flp pilus assembly protein TadG
MFKRTQKKEFGQALVETAITMPVLILILSGLLDLGRIYYTYIALEEAGAEAARYLAIEPECASSTDPNTSVAGNPCADPNNAIYRAKRAGNDEFDVTLSTWNIPYDADAIAAGFDDPFSQCGGVVSIGCVVTVQLSYPYEFITPGISAIANNVSGGNGLTLTVQATEIMVYED